MSPAVVHATVSFYLTLYHQDGLHVPWGAARWWRDPWHLN
jgi:hypothetical protein